MLFSIFFLCNCSTPNNNTEQENVITNKTSIEQDTISISAEEIKEQLKAPVYNKIVYFDKDTFAIPFYYSMNLNNSSLLWQLGDLEINSSAENYFSFSFEDKILHNHYYLDNGNMYLIFTENTEAITTKKIQEQLSDVSQMYYSDEESFIYRKDDRVDVIFFKYLPNKKSFAVYYANNGPFPLSLTLAQKLESAINQLRVAKNFFKPRFQNQLPNWNEYKKSLSNMHKKIIEDSRKEVLNAIDSLNDYQFKELESMDISLYKISKNPNMFWKTIQNYFANNKVNKGDFEIPGFKYTFGEIKNPTILYKDANSFVLKMNDPFDHVYYGTIVKTKINNVEVLMTTQSIKSWVGNRNTSKEMSFLYLSLFKSF
jgi:hypothetical protein